MLLMASANDLIIVFLALEILSIALYVLAAFDRRRLASQEAGLKYFVLGVVLVGGLPLRHRARLRRHRHDEPHRHRRRSSPPTRCSHDGVLLAGFALLLVGLGFKVAAVPFHMWTPDVYQGAPTPVTAFMASATKAAAFAAFLRIFVGAFPLYRVDWRPVDLRRSPCCRCRRQRRRGRADRREAHARLLVDRHAGYVLIGVQAVDDRAQGTERGALLPAHLRGHGDRRVRGRHARGAGARRRPPRARPTTAGWLGAQPVLAGLLTLFLLAQAGVPLTGGFVAKLSVFSAAVDAGQYWLALSACSRAVVGAFVYLRVSWSPCTPADDEAGEAPPARRGRIGAGPRWSCSWPPASWCSCSGSCPAPSCTSPATPRHSSDPIHCRVAFGFRTWSDTECASDDLGVAAPEADGGAGAAGAWPARPRRAPASARLVGRRRSARARRRSRTARGRRRARGARRPRRSRARCAARARSAACADGEGASSRRRAGSAAGGP